MALSEEQLEILGARLVPLYQQLERDVLNDIARRLMKTGTLTETAEIMAESLRLKGYSPAAIRREVMKLIGADKKAQKQIEQDTKAYKQLLKQRIAETNKAMGAEAETMWEDAGNLAFHEDLSVWKGESLPVKGSAFESLVKAMAKRAGGDLLDLTKSAGFRLADGSLCRARTAYTSELNRALVKLSSGAFSWQQCVEDAVRELAKSGLRTVDYESGTSRQIDTAVRCSVMTASAQLAGQISMQNCEEGGTEFVEVSAHWGARTGEGHANHAGWQGKVYCVNGSTDEYPNLEEVTGYPSDPRGLLGYNCRHVFYPFWPGISEPNDWPSEPEPATVDGRTYTYYQATQEQRRREREIRALKREESALRATGLTDKADEKKALIRARTVEYEEFSQDVGIRAKGERCRVCEGTVTAAEYGKALKQAGVLHEAD